MAEAFAPVTSKAKSPFVCRRIPDISTCPAAEKLHLPEIVTWPEKASQSYAARLTPAFSVRFSVYVPGRMKIVSPLDAAVNAAAMVV